MCVRERVCVCVFDNIIRKRVGEKWGGEMEFNLKCVSEQE